MRHLWIAKWKVAIAITVLVAVETWTLNFNELLRAYTLKVYKPIGLSFSSIIEYFPFNTKLAKLACYIE